ncbi:MAG TPA: peptidase domain-containing ABC transporter [Magnetospirillaceae bacterium]|jgi:ATP-binding cassette subfamily C protein LapB
MSKIIQPWLQPVVRPLRTVFREMLVISLFVNILALALPVFVQQVYDRVVGHQGVSTLKGLVIGMAVLLVFDFVLRQTRARIMQLIALKIDVEVGQMLFNKLLAVPLRLLETRPASYWQQTFRDADVIRNSLSGASALLILDLPFVLLFLAMIFVVAGPVAWVFVSIFPLFIALAWRSGAMLNQATNHERTRLTNRDTLLAEMIAGRTTIKALALEHTMRPLWEERQARTIEQSIQRGSRADGYVNLASLFTLGTNVLMTSVGALFIIDQSLTMGSLVASNMLVGRLLAPLNQLVGAWRGYASFRQAMERVGALLSEEEELRRTAVKMERPKGAITLDDLAFSYDPRLAPVLDGLNLVVPAGGITAVLGRNGSGKTTFLKLVQGLYRPTRGRVMLDGADIAQFGRDDIAGWIGYVPQECVLFTGTIKDNIAQGMDGATDDDVLRAAKLAGVHQYIVDLPAGYGTEIGEAGSRLSAGQRQRIALARALIGDPPVLLLDEPSASLDRQAEEELARNLVTLATDHTVIVVTHSPTLLTVARNSVVLDRAKIIAAGSTNEVLARVFPRGGEVQPIPTAPRPAIVASQGSAS